MKPKFYFPIYRDIECENIYWFTFRKRIERFSIPIPFTNVVIVKGPPIFLN